MRTGKTGNELIAVSSSLLQIDLKIKRNTRKRTQMRFSQDQRTAVVSKLIGLAAVTALTFTSGASASSHHPSGEFLPFAECPMNRLPVTECLVAEITGGSLTLGSKTVAIKDPVKLQGGFGGGGSEAKFFGAQNGETLPKVPQPLPTGALGSAPAAWPKSIQSWFSESIRKSPGVTATIELAAPATSIRLNTESLVLEEGVAIVLPVKIKLTNPLLGSNCYLGSSQSPIILPLGTGTSGKLKGGAGHAFFNEDFTLITIKGARLVNASFLMPPASGCGGTFSSFVDPFLSSIFGATSTGKNFADLELTLLDAPVEVVKESE